MTGGPTWQSVAAPGPRVLLISLSDVSVLSTSRAQPRPQAPSEGPRSQTPPSRGSLGGVGTRESCWASALDRMGRAQSAGHGAAGWGCVLTALPAAGRQVLDCSAPCASHPFTLAFRDWAASGSCPPLPQRSYSLYSGGRDCPAVSPHQQTGCQQRLGKPSPLLTQEGSAEADSGEGQQRLGERDPRQPREQDPRKPGSEAGSVGLNARRDSSRCPIHQRTDCCRRKSTRKAPGGRKIPEKQTKGPMPVFRGPLCAGRHLQIFLECRL